MSYIVSTNETPSKWYSDKQFKSAVSFFQELKATEGREYVTLEWLRDRKDQADDAGADG